MSEFKFYKGWAEDAGRAAGLAERGGGPVEAVTVRRPSNYIVHQREQVLERMRARGTKNANHARRLDRALAETDIDEGKAKP